MVNVWKIHQKHKYRQLSQAAALCGHYGPITALVACSSYSILVSGGQDCNVFLWDLNRLIMTRALPRLPLPVTAIAINQLTGDIVTAAGPHLFVWTINGDLAAQRTVSVDEGEAIDCVAFSQGPDYSDDHCIITGHRDGTIRFWSLEVPEGAMDDEAEPTTAEAANEENTDSTATTVPQTPAARQRTTPASSDSPVSSSPLFPPSDSSVRPFLALVLRHFLTGHAPSNGLSASGPAPPQSGATQSTGGHGITALHTSSADYRRLWSGDRQGRVLAWSISLDGHWEPDAAANACAHCGTRFTPLIRRHHCRYGGEIVCGNCSSKRMELPSFGFYSPVRVCDVCVDKAKKHGRNGGSIESAGNADNAEAAGSSTGGSADTPHAPAHVVPPRSSRVLSSALRLPGDPTAPRPSALITTMARPPPRPSVAHNANTTTE